jgi:hypothetical protein
MRWVALVLVLGACNGSKALEPVDSAAPPATTPDLWEGMGFDEACSDYDGVQVAGATSWFVGEYDVDFSAGEATGTEWWVLYANDPWTSAGGRDCAIEWTVHALVTDVSACATCDFGLYAEGIPDLEASDCPEELEDFEAIPWDVTYDVRVDADGTATFYFGDTGTLVGTGFALDDHVEWRRDSACVWF